MGKGMNRHFKEDIKMVSKASVSHQGNANQNPNEISLHTHQIGYNKKDRQ